MIPKPLSSPCLQPITLTGELVRMAPLSLPPPAALVEPPFVLNPHSTLTAPQAPVLSIKLRIDIQKRGTLRSQPFPIVPH
jgi:hypothetical protein